MLKKLHWYEQRSPELLWQQAFMFVIAVVPLSLARPKFDTGFSGLSCFLALAGSRSMANTPRTFYYTTISNIIQF